MQADRLALGGVNRKWDFWKDISGSLIFRQEGHLTGLRNCQALGWLWRGRGREHNSCVLPRDIWPGHYLLLHGAAWLLLAILYGHCHWNSSLQSHLQGLTYSRTRSTGDWLGSGYIPGLGSSVVCVYLSVVRVGQHKGSHLPIKEVLKVWHCFCGKIKWTSKTGRGLITLFNNCKIFPPFFKE